jgi:hypothetical protein
MTFIPGISGMISTNNSTATPLAGSATFTGTNDDCSKFASVSLTIHADVDSAASGVSIQFSIDGTNYDIKNTFTYSTGLDFAKHIIVEARYMRVVFINGSAAQATFRLQTGLHISRSATDTPQTIIPSPALLDAFSRIRVSNPQTQLSITHVLDPNAEQETESKTGTGTITLSANSPNIILAVTTTGDTAVRQSRARGIYVPGKSLLVLNTGILNNASNATGVTTRIGYFDADDGLYFQHEGNGSTGTTSVCKRSSGTGSIVNTVVNQTSWNLDTMNGSGTSGISLNFTKTQIFLLDLEWLGVGRVRMGFVVNGMIYYCHEFLHANFETIPYMNLGSQPVRYEARSTSGAGSMMHCCSTVIAEGEPSFFGRGFSATAGLTTKTVAAANPEPIIALRLKSTGKFPKVNVILTKISIASSSAANMALWLYIFRDTTAASVLTGSSFVSADTESAVEYDITATAITLTGGVLLDSSFYSGDSTFNLTNLDNNNNIKITTNLASQSDILVFVAQAFAGSESVSGAMTWREVL